MENCTYIIFNSTLLTNNSVICGTQDDTVTFKCFNNKDIRLLCSKLCESHDYNTFIKNITYDNMSEKRSICFLYGSPSSTGYNFGQEILLLATEACFKENVNIDMNSNYRTVGEIKSEETEGLYFCLVGIKDKYYYDLLHKNMKKYEFDNVDNFTGLQIPSIKVFSEILQNHTSILEIDETNLVLQEFIYILIYANKNPDGICNFEEYYFIDLQNSKYECNVNDEKVDTNNKLLSKKQLVANLKFLKNILNTNKKVYSILKINSTEDILQASYIQEFVTEFTQNKSIADINLHSDVSSLKQKIQHLEKKLILRESMYKRQLKNLDRQIRKEVVDQVSDIHRRAISSQKDNFNRLLEHTNCMYMLKLDTLENYYISKIRALEMEHDSGIETALTETEPTKQLLERITNLEKQKAELILEKTQNNEQLKTLQNRLDCIKNALEGKSIDSSVKEYEDKENIIPNDNFDHSVTDNVNIPNSNIKENSTEQTSSIPFIKKEAEQDLTVKDLQKQLDKKELLLNKAYTEIDNLKSRLKEEINHKQQLAKELVAAEYLTRQLKRQAAEYFNDPMSDIVRLQEEKQNMEARHKEQFQRYEKMLQKSREEIDNYNRELRVVRQHFIHGNSSPLFVKSDIKKQIGTSVTTPKGDPQTSSSSNSAKKSELNTNTPKEVPETTSDCSNKSCRILRSGKKIGI